MLLALWFGGGANPELILKHFQHGLELSDEQAWHQSLAIQNRSATLEIVLAHGLAHIRPAHFAPVFGQA